MKLSQISLNYLEPFSMSLSALAQSNDRPYRIFRVDVSPGLSLSMGKNVRAVSATIEPKLSITKNLSIGLNLGLGSSAIRFNNEAISFTESGTQSKGTIDGVSWVAFTMNAMVTLDWHFFASKTVRPYIGVGAGLSSYGGLGVFAVRDASNNYSVNAGGFDMSKTFTVTPRIGVDIWHIRINLAYYLPLNPNKEFSNITTEDGTKTLTNVTIPDMDYSTFALQLYFYFGGGKKNSSSSSVN